MDKEKQKGRSSAEATIEEEAPLSLQRAFVVQFRVGAGGELGHFAGRVERMVSGQAARFHSVEELVVFIRQVPSNRMRRGSSNSKSTVWK